MPLTPGTRLGVYEITAPLGEGGMGQVYRAIDTTLGRQVAIKILPDAFSADPDRLARFEREAKTLASLNHPQIAAIYGFEKSPSAGSGQAAVWALVMELVEGDDLSEKLVGLRAQGSGLPIDEALPIAKQIAEALEAAHEQGIVHRDLKPANIKVRADGAVKVLDFGLAKAVGPSKLGPYDPGTGGRGGLNVGAELAPPEMSPTLTSPAMMTGIGVILGTAAYMSPEQARGKAVDKRADIWAFGAVLFEMLAGARAFPGDDVGETLATVVKTEPDWSLLPAGTPAPIRTLLQRCLRKDPRQRLADAGAVRIEIEDAMAAPAAGAAVKNTSSRLSMAVILMLAGSAIAAAAALAGVRLAGSRAPMARRDVTRLVLPLAAGVELADGPSVVMAPDGSLVAYTANRGGISELYTRSLSNVDAHVVPGTRGAVGPFFSPDGHWLGFFADRKLKKVSTSGGAVVTVADGIIGGGSGAWGPDDRIVFTSVRGLTVIPASGGEAHPLTAAGQEGPTRGLGLPEFLPGGEALLVTSSLNAVTARDVLIQVLNLKTGRLTTLVQASQAHYLASGHLMYLVDGTVWAVPLDLQKLETTGAAVAILSGVRQQLFTGSAAFSCSLTGDCVYSAGATAAARTIAIVDRTGTAQTLSFPPKSYSNPRFSPAGDKVSLWVEQLLCTIEIADLARGTITRFTSDGDNHFPIWTPDGARITYLSQKTRSNPYRIVSRPANGSGAEEDLLPAVPNLNPLTPLAWSPGGALAFAHRGDIWLLPRDGEPRAFEPSPSVETAPAFSPDGRWLAYVSDESGRDEIYVRPFPGPGAKYLVSTGGGREPVWSRSSRELFFRNGDQVLAVQVATTTPFSASRPNVLFTGAFSRARDANRITYDVSPDGQRFVMLNSGEEDRAVTQVSVLLNWFEELKARVPMK